MNYWLVKSEPVKYSWQKFNQDGRTFGMVCVTTRRAIT